MKNFIITFALFLSAFSVKAQFSGGDGSQQDPYQVSTVAQLDSIRYFLESHFILLNDLDIGDWISNHADADIQQNGWNPIDSVFHGSLNGQGYTLSGFSINRPKDIRCGLFKELSTTAYLHDIKMDSVDLFVYHGSGVFASWGRGKIENCSVIGGTIHVYGTNIGGIFGSADSVTAISCWTDIKIISVKDSITGYIGGLFGDSYRSEIKSCYAKGEVHGLYDVGGLVGFAYETNFTNCSYTGNITSKQKCGGLAGSAFGNNVNNCYTSGKIEARSLEYLSVFSGGLFGLANYSTIKNCYSTMDILSPDMTVGGLVGYSQESSTIQNCYAAGVIEGNSRVGGLFGQIYDAIIENCVALNPSITVNDTSTTRRIGIIYVYRGGGRQQNNFAFEGMLLNGERQTGTSSGSNGEDLSGEAILQQSTYTQSPLEWDFTPQIGDWKMPTNGCLPILAWQEDPLDTAIDCSLYLSYLSVKNITKSENIYSVYPSPTSDYVNVQISDEVSSTHDLYAYLYDITGRLLNTQILTNKITRIDLTNLTTGIYIIKINNQTFKVVKNIE